VLLGLGVTVLLGHTEINHVNDIGGLGSGASNKEVVRFDISVDEVLLVDRLNAGKLVSLARGEHGSRKEPTICLATITTVLVENRRLQWSKRSSRLGPRRSITRILCRPS
jgi:hypothetical protein